jgi:hypothetical protein
MDYNRFIIRLKYKYNPDQFIMPLPKFATTVTAISRGNLPVTSGSHIVGPD